MAVRLLKGFLQEVKRIGFGNSIRLSNVVLPFPMNKRQELQDL
jgi:hypothetical protein